MELFWIIVGYTAVLAVCFLIGEYLQDRRLARRQPERQSAQQSPDPCDADQQPPHTAAQEDPLQAEVLPDPRQTAQTISRDLERLALSMAERLGVDQAQVEGFFASGVMSCPPPQPEEIIDVDENEEQAGP